MTVPSAECQVLSGCRVPGAGCGVPRAVARTVAAVACLIGVATPARAQVAVHGETVHTMAGAPLKDGVVLIGKNGKIERVGPAASVRIPAGLSHCFARRS